MVLGKLPVPGRPTVWMIVGQSLKIEHRADLNSSRCMHDPSFVALALIISDLNAKTRHLTVNHKK